MKNSLINTKRWEDNSVVLYQSKLSKLHRNMVLKRSMFHKLVTDKNTKILDVGCGSGPFLIYFASKGFHNLYGIEPDAELTKNIPGDIGADVRNHRAENIGFDDNTFDVVFVYGVLHHLEGSKAYQEACDEILRVLKPGGYLFVMEPVRYWILRTMDIISKYLGFFSKTSKSFSECVEEEYPIFHMFVKNQGTIRDYLRRRSSTIFVDKHFLYTWIFTAQKMG
jgi:2-polyprenyl-3-methyl-5-hydroxy-6-metoxy-1,4-benzoquinol methylase